jgi:phytoene dehydrogenase-like protein
MNGRYDVAVAGGGHNGLVAATFLGRAGLRVVVLERGERVGGTLATDELHPGYRAPAAFAGLERVHPAIVAELGLERHGLRFIEPRGGTLQLLEGGESLLLDPEGDLDRALSRHSPRDAGALRSFEGTRRDLAKALEPLLTAPLPRLSARLAERASDLVLVGKTWRGLGRTGHRAALRLLPMNVRDALDERFESAALKAALAVPALEAGFMGPRSAGSLWNLLWQRPAWVPHLLAPPRFAAGGPGAFTAALEAAARQAGVEIRTDAAVERIAVSGGAVQGVVLEGGVEVGARRVVSALDPRRTLLGLLDPGALDVETASEVRALRGRGNVAIVRLALDRPPRFGSPSAGGEPAGGSLAGRIQTGAALDDLERAYDASKYGLLAERPALQITVPSVADPALAPAGRAVVHVWVQFTPHRPGASARDDEELRSLVERRVLATLEEHDRGFTASVLAASVLTPAALEQRFGLTEGCLYHVEPALDQQLWLRPLLGWHLHSTPLEGLYLAGPGTHPGGGPTGLPGRCAARRLLADLGPRRGLRE